MEIRNKFSEMIEDSFRALSHRDFRYFWVGQCISLIGTWMQLVGQSWLVLQTTNSAFLLGLVSALQFLPMLLFSTFAGVFVDKYPKKKLLIGTQTTFMILAFILAGLVWSGSFRYWQVALLALLLGFANTVDFPARQSYMIELVGKNDLMNAIALNGSIFNVARVVGPVLAALTMAYLGAGACFFINGLSFIAVIAGLFMIKGKPFVRPKKEEGNVLREVYEGLRYISKSYLLYTTLILVAVNGIFAMNYQVLIPVFTVKILKIGETGYGFLMAIMGIGSVISAIYVASRSKHGPKNILLYASITITSVMLILSGLARTFFFAAVLFAVTGFFTNFFIATSNTTVQLNTNPEYLGRVMSIYTVLFNGMAPVGNFLSGAIADRFGVSASFYTMGGAMILFIGIIYIIRYKKERMNTAS